MQLEKCFKYACTILHCEAYEAYVDIAEMDMRGLLFSTDGQYYERKSGLFIAD